MLIVALPVGFVMEFADVYRKCKKIWLLGTYAYPITKYVSDYRWNYFGENLVGDSKWECYVWGR